MSAYITLLTPMTEEDCLIQAIIDEGLAREQIESSVVALPLRGWQRDQAANIVLRKEHTGDRYNDIGFLRTDTGYLAILSNDHPRFGSEWLARLNLGYGRLLEQKQARAAADERLRMEEERKRLVQAQRDAVVEKARALGYQVTEKREGQNIRLVLVKRTY